MMPFSVLRMWGLGSSGWILLGLGVYCLWEWADGVDPPLARRVERDPGTEQTTIVRERLDESNRDRQGGWPYLVAGLVVLGFSFGGGLPLVLLAGKPRLTDEPAPEPDQIKTVERPDGSRLHVECYGDNKGPTLVFTHGWSLDRTAWTYVRDALKDKYRVVIWDLPGLGRSQGPTSGDFSLEKMAADLEAVVQVAGKGPIVLVGHSIGGMIVQTYCRLFRGQLGPRVSALVLVTTTYTNPLRTAFGAPLWTAIERPVLVPLNHLTVWLAPLAWLSNWQSYMNGSLQLVTRIASFCGKQTLRQLNYGALLAAKAWPAVVARGNLAMVNFDEQKQLPQIDIPVLVIAASHDRMTKAEASDRIEELIPRARQIRIPTGHLGLWEHRRELASLIAEFVDVAAHKHDAPQRGSPAARNA
jgi:pimeloyl-ACP methyl ester carboxylesterase